MADHRMGDRRAGEGNLEHRLASFLDALLHCQAGFLRLAVAEPDPSVAVADDHERGEREPPAALDDLGDAVHLDGALFVLGLWHPQNSNPASRAASARAATRPW